MANKTYFWEASFGFSSVVWIFQSLFIRMSRTGTERKVWLSTLEVRHKKGNMRETDINKVVVI